MSHGDSHEPQYPPPGQAGGPQDRPVPPPGSYGPPGSPASPPDPYGPTAQGPYPYPEGNPAPPQGPYGPQGGHPQGPYGQAPPPQGPYGPQGGYPAPPQGPYGNQAPPQGRYGNPQDQPYVNPQGPHGYPQDQPYANPQGPYANPQGAYVNPQAPYAGPQAPYGPQGQYGAPQGTPPGYGAPQGYGGPPPYGPPPAKGGRTAWLLVGGAVVLVVVVVAAFLGLRLLKDGGTDAGTSGGTGGTGGDGGVASSTGELTGQVGWRVAAVPVANRVNLSGVLGSWVTPGAFVRADNASMYARDSVSGKALWELRPPQGAKFCGVSQEAAGGAVAVAYGTEFASRYSKTLTNVHCLGVMLVDLATGKARWQTELTDTYSATTLKRIGATPPDTMPLAISDGAVFAVSYWSAVGLSITDGARLWEAKELKAKGGETSCIFRDVLVGKAGAVTLASCDRANPVALLAFDPATGRQRWRSDLSAADTGDDTGIGKWLVAADPLVVALPVYGGGGRYLVVGDDGRTTATIAEKGSYGTLDMQAIGLSAGARPRYHAVVAMGTLVASTKAARVTDLRDSNSLVAFDLATGRPRWTKDIGKKSTIVPAVADGGSVIAMRTGTYEEPPQPFRFQLADGSGGAMGPAYDRELIYTPTNCLYRYSGKALFLVSNTDTKIGAALLR
ncbi:outer membrane protein assembly factor BamB family protein [Sphaerisporangium corydalis]|uniref:PQQ-binding-like beta-propeller repeat protein n=1 Tax=Sphaerisporangium corydalis TaxID=1441875 RepID=A0ABV9EAU3_9ACTN|nr:PQQ-binding-like beta-propeller repeat protein [Sphaerisporangium corydalis]